MNKLINSPQNNGKTEPLAYIDATIKAGFDGIGIRTYRTPTRTYNFNPIVGNKDLERDVKHALKDSGLEMYDLYSFYLQPEMEWDVIIPALEFGGEIGCQYCLIIGDDTDWNRMVDSMGRMVDLLTPLGMKAVFESHASQAVAPAPVLTPIQKCVDFVDGLQAEVRRHLPRPTPVLPRREGLRLAQALRHGPRSLPLHPAQRLGLPPRLSGHLAR